MTQTTLNEWCYLWWFAFFGYGPGCNHICQMELQPIKFHLFASETKEKQVSSIFYDLLYDLPAPALGSFFER